MALLRRIALKVEIVNKVHLLCAIEIMVPMQNAIQSNHRRAMFLRRVAGCQ